MHKFFMIGIDLAIIALIFGSMFSGGPTIKNAQPPAVNPASVAFVAR